MKIPTTIEFNDYPASRSQQKKGSWYNNAIIEYGYIPNSLCKRIQLMKLS
jgi:hypothetical protein